MMNKDVGAIFLLLAEDFGGWRLVRGALVIASVYLVKRRERPPRS